MVRTILKRNKLPKNLKKNLLSPTKIYVSDVLKLFQKNLINAAANITGGGLIENVIRSVPNNLTVNIDLSRIKTLKFSHGSDQKIYQKLKC